MLFQTSIFNNFLLTIPITASAIPLLVIRQRELCNYPSTFTISRFTTFTPDSSNSAQHSIYFELANDFSPELRVKCRAKYTSPLEFEGAVCENNPRVFFDWDGSELTIKDNIGVCTQDPDPVTDLQGLVKPALNCYPTPLFLGLGAGTTCQPPVDQFSSEFFTEPTTEEEEGEYNDQKNETDNKDGETVDDIVKEILEGKKSTL